MINLSEKKTWLVTGCAGFIGSNILEFLLKNEQNVIGLDNFSTGFQHNLDEVQNIVGMNKWQNFNFIKGDIRDFETCYNSTKNVDIVIHQAALGSIPRSINDPITTHNVNITGLVNMLKASNDNKIQRFVYASSSSVYGDSTILPKKEYLIGNQLSPYAVTKYSNELYANVFAKSYNMETIGLRYFNVFGKRQDPHGAYAAVIPLWFKAILNNEEVFINGDGETSRDFCYIDNVVEMNILCGLTNNKNAINKIYNVACNEQTTLNQLFNHIKQVINYNKDMKPTYRDYRNGDIRHSLADISLAQELMGYSPKYKILDGLKLAANWYKDFFQNKK